MRKWLTSETRVTENCNWPEQKMYIILNRTLKRWKLAYRVFVLAANLCLHEYTRFLRVLAFTHRETGSQNKPPLLHVRFHSTTTLKCIHSSWNSGKKIFLVFIKRSVVINKSEVQISLLQFYESCYNIINWIRLLM